MKNLAILTLTLFVFAVTGAKADPVGVYHVEGSNPGGSGTYEGEVEVARNGDTYTVVWIVGGQEYIGTGLGAASANGSLVMGQADDKDIALTVSYISGDGFGLAFFVKQDNGQWKGIWTYGGSKQIGQETWTPAN